MPVGVNGVGFVSAVNGTFYLNRKNMVKGKKEYLQVSVEAEKGGRGELLG